MNAKIENIKKNLNNGSTCLDIIMNCYEISSMLEKNEITEKEYNELMIWNFAPIE